MANPVLDSIAPAGPVSANVGAKVTVTAVAHDDDNRTETFTFTVTDEAGHVSQPATLTVQWTDKLTLRVTSDGGSPISVSGMTATLG